MLVLTSCEILASFRELSKTGPFQPAVTGSFPAVLFLGPLPNPRLSGSAQPMRLAQQRVPWGAPNPENLP